MLPRFLSLPRSSLRLGKTFIPQVSRRHTPAVSFIRANSTATTDLPSISPLDEQPSDPGISQPRVWHAVPQNPDRLHEQQRQADSWIRGLTYNSTTLKLVLNGPTHHIPKFHLRDACRCPKCVDPSTKQKNFRTTDTHNDLQIKSVKNEDGKIAVEWINDLEDLGGSHVSLFSKYELCSLLPSLGPKGKHQRGRIFWNERIFTPNQPWISFDDYIKRGSDYWRWMRDLQRYGLAFIKDAPQTTDAVTEMATQMGPVRNSFYGSTWDVRSIPDAKNVAYTNKRLGFHMDLLYMNEPPGYQLLHCMNNSLAGGESLFVDGLRVANSFKPDSDEFDILTKFPVRFGYDNADEYYEKSRPTIELDPTSSLRKATNAPPRISHINYSPPFQLPFTRSDDDDWYVKFRKFKRAHGLFTSRTEWPGNVFKLKLNPGDCVVFENRRVLHAREAFETESGEGERWLRGAYVDSDAVQSRFRNLRSRDTEGWDSKLLVKGLYRDSETRT